MVEPLAPGEHVDLDSGTVIKRWGGTERTDDNDFTIKTTFGGDSATITRDEIRQLAELAGYGVIDQ